MVFSVCLSVCPSVCLSVCPSHLFDYVPIIVSSWNFQELSPRTIAHPWHGKWPDVELTIGFPCGPYFLEKSLLLIIGPGKVLSFSNFSEYSWKSPYFLIKSRLMNRCLMSNAFYQFNKQPVPNFMLYKVLLRNKKKSNSIRCGVPKLQKRKFTTYMWYIFGISALWNSP